MSKGQIFHSTFSEYTDPYTGTVVKRLTDPYILSHHMYFYNRVLRLHILSVIRKMSTWSVTLKEVLIDVKKRTEKKLCYHSTSWLAKHGNPHPCFSEDNKSIIFVSDR